MNFTVGGMSFFEIEYYQEKYNLSAGSAGIIFGGMIVFIGFFATMLGGAVLDKVKQGWINDSMGISYVALKLSLLYMLLALVGAGFPLVNDVALALSLNGWCFFFLCLCTIPLNSNILWSVELKNRSFALSMNQFCIH